MPYLLAERAVGALIEEAELTPKPALVDRRGSGAHRDLNLPLMLRSAEALQPGFVGLARAAEGQSATLALRKRLGEIGREMEAAMVAATGGVNAHRGAIWALGLLVAGAAMNHDAHQWIKEEGGTIRRFRTHPPSFILSPLAARAAALARLPDAFVPQTESHGQRACRRYGVPGARGEARAGFPHVVTVGLPALRSARAKGATETSARLDALLAIMARLEDTCLLHRGGMAALRAAQDGARAALAAGGYSTQAGRMAMEGLELDLLARGVSPGGSADLLAATLFVDGLEGRGGTGT